MLFLLSSTRGKYGTRYEPLPEYGEQITLSIDRKYTSVRITVGSDILHWYNMHNLLVRHNVWEILHIAEWHTASISSYNCRHTEGYTGNAVGTNNNSNNSIHMRAVQADNNVSDIVHFG